MKSLLKLSKIFIIFLFFTNLSYSTEPVDIWNNQTVEENALEKNENEQIKEDSEKITVNEKITISDVVSLEIVEGQTENLVGLFDPDQNNLSLSMWLTSDGQDIKDALSRINRIKLSNFSKDLLHRVLFTNSFAPGNNFSAEDFLNFKINWLLKQKKIEDLEKLLIANPNEIGRYPEVLKFLINEYLSSTEIDLACKKIELMDRNINNNYLEKLFVYCLIHQSREEEAKLVYEIMKEDGFKDKFFENKILYLLGITDSSDQIVKDDNLFNFFISHITAQDFTYKPTQETDKYIWQYLSSANLLDTENFEENEEENITIYEQATADGVFDNEKLFDLYSRINFNLNQLLNAHSIYKTLPNYKARALIYQKILLSDNIEKKLELVFLLKDLFEKDNIFSAYKQRLEAIFEDLNESEIPERYIELFHQYKKEQQKLTKNIKYNNEIIHQSKIINYFFDDNYKINKVEKDFRSIYKKIKKNKNYFISIKDIVVLDSLKKDGITFPEGLIYKDLETNLVIPEGLNLLTEQKQIGLVLLKIVEIIGEDEVENLDPETVYFITKILNKLELTKIRNQILSISIPKRV